MVKKIKNVQEDIHELIAEYTYDWELWLDGKNNIKWTNSAVERMTGYTVKECLATGQFPNTFFFKDNDEEIEKIKVSFSKKKGGNDKLLLLTRRDEKTLWVGLSWQAIYDKHKKWLGTRVSVRNTDARKKIEQDFLDSEIRYKLLFDNSPIGVALVSTTGKWLEVNKKLVEFLGYRQKEFLSKNFQDITHPDDLKKDLQLVKKILSGDIDSYEIDKRYRHKKGYYLWAKLSVSLVRDKDNKALFFIKQIEDINERKKSEEKFRVLYEKSHDAITTLSPPDWKFTAANPATLKMFGVSSEKDFIYSGPGFFSPDKQANGKSSSSESKKMIDIAMKNGSHFFEWLHRKANGKVFYASVLLNKIELEGKTLLQATIRDISKDKEFEEKLQEKLQELQKMNRLMVNRELKMIELKNKLKKGEK